ncbi:unnamed protein product [Sphagnum tenellum]
MLIASKNHQQRCGSGGSGSYSSGRRFWWSTVLLLTTCLGVGISAWHGLVFSYPRRSIPPPCVLLPAAFGVQGSAPVASGLGASSSSSLSVPSLNLQPTAAVSVLFPSLHLIRSSSYNAGDLQLQQIVFGIAGASQLWEKRREFIKLWWRPKEMRGFVWLEEPPVKKMEEGENLPIVVVSEDTSGFRYTHPLGHPSGIRISRVVCESFRLHLPDVRWFVMGDDDTIFSAENLVRVLSKYDSREMWYIGSTSESHKQNDHFSHSMAYGGGGFAISYPLAEALAAMQDECLERYPQLFGSDDRLHACITELGVPLTREPGFHQFDVYGNAHGLLASHPVTPFISMHHLEVIEPPFPGLSALEGLKHLVKAMQTDPGSFLQQSICYDHKLGLSISISLGYVVQVFPEIILPRILTTVETSFTAWNHDNSALEFSFDTRPVSMLVCKQPFLFYMEGMHVDENNSRKTVSTYGRYSNVDKAKTDAHCWFYNLPPEKVQKIMVISESLTTNWYMVPRRQCAKLMGMKDKELTIHVGVCKPGELVSD